MIVTERAVYSYRIDDGFALDDVKEYLESKAFKHETSVSSNVEAYVREGERKD
jgi:hypothetical protein